MSEPKFTDASCYGKEFDGRSKICRVCLANRSCQLKYFKQFAAPKSAQNLSLSLPQQPELATLRPASDSPALSARQG